MIRSADIRKENRKMIYEQMLDGSYYTKQQISQLTGLSVATCNTLLNELKSEGVVTVSDTKELRGIGRGSELFTVNPNHEYYALIRIQAFKDKDISVMQIIDACGRTVEENRISGNHFDLQEQLSVLNSMIKRYSKTVHVIISVPGVVDEGKITFSDISELENVDLAEQIRKATGCEVTVINDMHAIAIGYQSEHHDQENVITLAGFDSQLLPGTVTMHKGQIISGANGIAGLIGFMQMDAEQKRLNALMSEKESMNMMSNVISALITIVNPSKIVLHGDLLSESTVNDLTRIIAETIPQKYIPEFVLAEEFDSYLMTGMYQIAVDSKKM